MRDLDHIRLGQEAKRDIELIRDSWKPCGDGVYDTGGGDITWN